MKNYKLFCENKDQGYFYKIHFNEDGVEDYLICDTNMCAKSDRTFDIEFFDFVKNKKLQKVLFDIFVKRTEILIDFLVHDNQKRKKLLTNPTIRILAEKDDILLDLLEIFDPDDIRVAIRKYNL
jgi:hypothetical protein